MPSGPKKRKAAKRKMESLGVRVNDSSPTTIPQGNGDSESSSEVASPMSPDVGQFEEEQEKGEERDESESSGIEGTFGSSENGGMDVKKGDVIEAEEVPSSLSSDTAAVVSISQAEDVSVEHVEPVKEVEVGSSELGGTIATEVIREEMLETLTPIMAASVSLSEEKEVAAQVRDFPIERVEVSNSGQFPSDGKEEEVEASSLVESPSDENLGKIEGSGSMEPPFDNKEEKVISLSGPVSAEQPAETGVQHLHSENRGIDTEVILPPQAVQRASWLNCCGLFDAFSGSSR